MVTLANANVPNFPPIPRNRLLEYNKKTPANKPAATTKPNEGAMAILDIPTNAPQ